MKISSDVTEFIRWVTVLNGKLNDLAAKHSSLEAKKGAISGIAKEYLRIKVLDEEETRAFLIKGIEVAQERIAVEILKVEVEIRGGYCKSK